MCRLIIDGVFVEGVVFDDGEGCRLLDEAFALLGEFEYAVVVDVLGDVTMNHALIDDRTPELGVFVGAFAEVFESVVLVSEDEFVVFLAA